MRLEGIELLRGSITLRSPFRTSFGVLEERDLLLVRAVTGEAEGWGECVAFPSPSYSSEYVGGVVDVLERFLIPHLFERAEVNVESLDDNLRAIRGHRMAKAALEAALLDTQLKAWGVSFASYLGATRTHVPAGVSVGIPESISALLSTIESHLEVGYEHIKIKIAPGWDVEPLRAVREAFGDRLPLQVDANAAYTLGDQAIFRELDRFDLVLIEQPLGEDDLRQHAELARLISTPIALDESITSIDRAADAIALGSCKIINIKPGRVGGYLNSRRIHDLCRANGIPVWCGGMAETGIGRAANVGLAAMPGFVPGDNSASNRYYDRDITEPFLLEDGHLKVPIGAGFGVTPIPGVLDEIVHSRTWYGKN